MEIPLETRRLFPGYADVDLATGLPFLIARLLEDGDEADLRWLTRNLPETELAAWLGQRGGRQLSLRSRAFWEAVLGRPAGGEVPTRKDLWPL
ncbi:MAG TPA: hypothetical protein VF179_24745 [Thermoanaerobaculia bacterium]|nr:hypothetical protein [Thermoanaerobaculia bacterium]